MYFLRSCYTINKTIEFKTAAGKTAVRLPVLLSGTKNRCRR